MSAPVKSPDRLDSDRLDELLSVWEASGRSDGVLSSLCDSNPSLASALKSSADALGRADSTLHRAVPGDDARPQTPGYRIVRFLGQGGMGTVWEAEQLSNRRHVALKVLPGHLLASPKARARFEREVELASRLDHPHIARVYESGVDRSSTGGQSSFHYSMELVDGVPINAFAFADWREKVRCLKQCAEALAFAHTRGILHRDLKPTNLLVSRSDTGEAVPHLLDFGLAKDLHDVDGVALTVESPFAGTPGYCSPEQARGEQTDTRSDVFSLGLIAAEVLTGKHPLDLTLPPPQLVHRLATTPVRVPEVAKGELPADLLPVLSRALAFSADERYASAASIVSDLQAVLENRPVSVKRRSPAYVLRKWVGRNRRVAAVIATATVVLTAGAAFLGSRVYIERQAASRNAQIAAEANAFVTELLMSSTPDAAQGKEVTAREVLERAAVAVDGRSLLPEVEAHVRHTLGTAIGALGDSARGVTLLRQALAIRQEKFGPDAPETLETMDFLGRTLTGRPLGPEFEEGLELLRQAWEGKRRLVSQGRSGPLPRTEEGKQAVVTGMQYIFQLDYMGRRKEASAVIQTLLADIGNEAPPEDWVHGLDMLRLRLLVEQKDMPAALELANRILREREARHGPNHTLVANGLFNVARVHEMSENWPEAESAYRRCLAIRVGFVPEHPSSDDTRIRLATVLKAQGRMDEAEALLDRVTTPQVLEGIRREKEAARNKPPG